MPAAIPLVGLAVSAGTSIYSATQANKKAKKAQKAIDGYQRQDLANPYESLQVSTLGADRQREDLARAVATNANLAAMGGSRAILGLSPQMIAQQNAQNAQIVANLDEQEKQRQQLIAGGGMQVQGMTEQRENNDLLGLGNLLQTARAERTSAINGLIQSGTSAASLATSGYLNNAKSTGTADAQNNWGVFNKNGGNGVFGAGVLNRNSGNGVFGNALPQAIGNNGYQSSLIEPVSQPLFGVAPNLNLYTHIFNKKLWLHQKEIS